MSLICSARKQGIVKRRFLIWSMDNRTHARFTRLGYLSHHNPVLYPYTGNPDHGANIVVGGYLKMMRQRPEWWKMMVGAGVSFFFIDSDVVIIQEH